MNKIKNYIVERGFSIMLYGMGTIAVGVLVHMYITFNPALFTRMPWMIQASAAVAITGLAIYVVGRVSVAMQRKRKRKKPLADDEYVKAGE